MEYVKLVNLRIVDKDHNLSLIGKAPAFSRILPGDKVRLADGSEREVASTLDVERGGEIYNYILSIFCCEDGGEPLEIVGVYNYREFRGDCG